MTPKHMTGMEFALMVQDWRVAEDTEIRRDIAPWTRLFTAIVKLLPDVNQVNGKWSNGLEIRLPRRVVMWQGCCGRTCKLTFLGRCSNAA